jgi:inosine/xanthosine triphosphatase
MQLLIGSKNPIKVKSVKNVFRSYFLEEKLDIFSAGVPSEFSNQPVGLDEVINGAKNRAKNIIEKFSGNWDYSIGIEAGLVKIPSTISGFLDYQFCAIMNMDGNCSIGCGPGWEYPNSVVKSVLNNPEIEIGTIMGEISKNQNIKYEIGAIGHYSGGKITRTEITEQCIQMALIPFLNKFEYFKQVGRKEVGRK